MTYSTLLDFIVGGLISAYFLYCRGSSLPIDIDSSKRITNHESHSLAENILFYFIVLSALKILVLSVRSKGLTDRLIKMAAKRV